ncbi:MAG: hypothetical protein D6808_02640 [Candidatus Dadabacteria bacterium]|nr:MAG: hypothetical protein D6808_02640 [Candidatus Dadabacteria bacterium]
MCRKVIITISVLILFLAPIQYRTISEADLYLNKARKHLQSKDYRKAIEAYRMAVSWRSPFNKAAATAAKELRDLMLSLPEGSDMQAEAYWELRSALWSSRSWIDGVYGSEYKSVEDKLKEVGDSLGFNHPPKITQPVNPANQRIAFLSDLLFAVWVFFTLRATALAGSKRKAVFCDASRRPLLLASLFYCLWLISLSFV